MAKQMFLSPIIGDGSSPETAFRPSLLVTVNAANAARAGVPSSPPVAAITAWLPTDPTNGHPFRSWCLCIVAAKDLRPFQSVPGVFPIPVFPLDAKLTALGAGRLLALVAKLDALGIDRSSLVDGSNRVLADGWRDAIRLIGRAAGDTSFDENNFDAVDIA